MLSYGLLVRRNLTRKMLRSILLVLSIAIAFFIYGVLSTFQQGFEGSEATSERVVVTNKIGTNEPLPVSYWSKIRAMDGVEAVTHITRLRAYSVNEWNIIGANAVDPESYAAVYGSTYRFKPTMVQSMMQRRDAALVGRSLAEREGWSVGQRITLTSFVHANIDGSQNWSFEIAGIFDGSERTVDTGFLIVRHDYFNESLARKRDLVNLFGVLPKQVNQVEALSRNIDAAFANSSSETRTQPETEFMKAFLEQFANVKLIVRLIVGAAFVTILMIVANTIVFAIRERTAEVGIMKVLGFSRGRIVYLVLAETFLLFFVGLASGLLLTFAAMPVLSVALSSLVPSMTLTPGIVIMAVMLAVLFSLLTGFVPAVNAFRIPAAAALKSR